MFPIRRSSGYFKFRIRSSSPSLKWTRYWVKRGGPIRQPIIHRINMLSTGIRTDVGVKVHGQNLDTIYAVSVRVKGLLEGIPGIKDLYVEPITGGKYLIIDIKRDPIGRYGLSIEDVNRLVETAIGGTPLANTIEGRQRFSINVRLPQDYRNSIDRIKRIPIKTNFLGTIPLSSI